MPDERGCKIEAMTFARRLAAAATALVLSVFPLALERCWTACVTPVEIAQAAPAAHACHEASPGDGGGARMDPMARACAHGDQARVNESAGLAAAKTRTLILKPFVEPVPYVQAAVGSAGTIWSSLRSDLSRPPLPLSSPLRL
jgi:hypothetical protein